MFEVDRLEVHRIIDDIGNNLERQFTIKEAMLARQESESNTFSGSDGLNTACWKQTNIAS